jgi:hypothetical protein
MFSKKLKDLKDYKVGALCVVREGLDTPVYTITDVGTHAVALTYLNDNGDVLSAGLMPRGSLYVPTKAQLDKYNILRRIKL